MSQTDYITDLLDLKDKNITFTENISTKEIHGLTYKAVEGTLSYFPDFCSCCGTMNDNTIIKHGTKVSEVRLLSIAGHPAILRLRKQSFLCKSCGSTFSAKTPVVKENCFISNQIKLKITIDLTKKVSEKDIAQMHNVSHSTVSGIVDCAFQQFTPNKNYLPRHLLFDEFRSTKDARRAMSFLFCDADKHEIIDIVENRQLTELLKYFRTFSKGARRAVKTICIDFYTPYMTLIKPCFLMQRLLLIDFISFSC